MFSVRSRLDSIRAVLSSSSPDVLGVVEDAKLTGRLLR